MSQHKNSLKNKKDATIAVNKKAYHEYFIEQRYEAGIVLQGWEVKSLRSGGGRITEAYVVIRNGQVELIGAHMTPLPSASTHINPDPTRTRKLLLHEKEISTLRGLIDRKSYTLIPLKLYWNKGLAKLEIGLAKGKKQHDKRASIKEKDWNRDKQRLLKSNLK